MRNTRLPKSSRASELAAYGCVGAAVAFIMALTFGAMDGPERPRDVASNAGAVAAATP